MDDIILPSRTRSEVTSEDYLTPAVATLREEKCSLTNRSPQTPEDVLKELQSKPSLESLAKILRWLSSAATSEISFDINVPSPQAAKIINALVNSIVPDFWNTLSSDGTDARSRERQLLVRCLRNTAGIGALITRLRALIPDQKTPQTFNKLKTGSQITRDVQPILDVLNVLKVMLQKNYSIANLRKSVHLSISNPAQRNLIWKETISSLAGGRLLSVAAEANAAISASSLDIKEGSWLGNGQLYATWLSKNIHHMAISEKDESVEKTKEVSRILSMTLTLGYNDAVVHMIFVEPLAEGRGDVKDYRSLLHSMATYEQKNILQTIIRVISLKYIPNSEGIEDKTLEQAKKITIGGAAALLATFINGASYLESFLIEWLTATSGGNVGVDEYTRRGVIATLSSNNGTMEQVLKKMIDVFGDKLYIKHTPILHQEVNAQILLILAGYVSRSSQAQLSTLARSSAYINAISNRLAASSTRSKFLGMAIGTAISELVDPKEKRMNFKSEEIDGPDGQWYQNLVNVCDSVGSISDLKAVSPKPKDFSTKSLKGVIKRIKNGDMTSGTTSKVISIEEISDESENEDEDIPIYEKPDSDKEDSDEDPTLIQRNKPTAPVYIRDLIAGLRDTENYDRHKLALSVAASLIRRKSNFGMEVSDHIEELATQLTGLGDKYDIENFQQLRLQGMIAVMVARPLQMGQWFSGTYFNGEYSMSQRASILTALTMGARELAGFKNEDSALTGANMVPDIFPSKRLPERLHEMYSLGAKPLDSLVQKLERTIIRPLAAEAVDRAAGPKALKVRTFSSRMEVEKKRKKAIPNELAKVVADGIFYPLVTRWRNHLQSYGNRSAHTSHFLQAHFLKTLALLLHASGPSTLSLPQMTAEFWSLLLSVRTVALGDVTILEALLFGFLTILDVNEDKRRIAIDHAKELMETQAWVEGVFERAGGGSKEGEKVRMLAAGILVGTGEVIEKYQSLLLGDLMGFT